MTDYLTLDDLAKMFPLGRKYIRDTLTKRPDFPPPALQVSQKVKLWDRMDVERWKSRARPV